MAPRKKVAVGVSALIGKMVVMESKYDNKPLVGKLVSVDNDYLGVETDGRVFYFTKHVIRAIVEDTENVSSE